MWKINEVEWIDFELTSFCNIKCKQCFREVNDTAHALKNRELLTLDIIKDKFKKEFFPNIKIINFCGSMDEPTTHPQFFDICDHFKDWTDDLHMQVATNGSLRTKKWWSELPKHLANDHRVVFGIDGSDELSEVYREGSNFKKVKENWRAFIDAGGMAEWQFIVMEHNEHQLEDARKLANDEGFLKFKTIYSHRKNDKNITYTHKKKNNDLPNISCKYLKEKRIFINHLGNVIPCCFLNSKMLEYSVNRVVKDRFEEIIMDNGNELGNNIRYNSIEEIIEGDVFNDIVESWTDGVYIPKCESACKTQNRDIMEKVKLDTKWPVK